MHLIDEDGVTCVRTLHTRSCMCVHTPTLIRGFVIKSGGVSNRWEDYITKHSPVAASLRHTLPLKRPKVADTGLAAFLTHSALTHMLTHCHGIKKKKLYIKDYMISHSYNYYIRDIKYSDMQLRGSGEREKKNIGGSFFLHRFPLLLNLSSQFSCTTLLP